MLFIVNTFSIYKDNYKFKPKAAILHILPFVDTCYYGIPDIEEDIVILVIQSQFYEVDRGFLLNAMLLWTGVAFLCGLFLWFLRKWKSFAKALIDAFGVLVGNGSFVINRRAEHIFVVSLSIFAVFFNVQFTDFLFRTFTKLPNDSRHRSLKRFFDSNATTYVYEGLFHLIDNIKESTP